MSAAIATTGSVVARPPGSLAVALQLGRSEGLRLVRHPAWIGAVVIGVVLVVVGTWVWVPVLNRQDAVTVDALVPVAVATLVLVHLAVTRPLRHHTTDLFDATPLRAEVFSAGHLASLVYPFGFSLVVALAEIAYLKAVGGVGAPRVLVILTGPALVAAAGAMGVALARWLPHPLTGPLAIVALVALSAGLLNSGSLRPRAIAETFVPYLPGDHWDQGLGELSLQKPDAQLLYLASLVVLAGGITLLRHRRNVLTVALVCTGLACGWFFANERMVRPTRALQLAAGAEFVDPTEHWECEARAGVRYCAYPQYRSWIDRWAAVVQPIVEASGNPPPGGLALTQLPSDYELWGSDAWDLERYLHRKYRSDGISDDRTVHPGMHWGRNVDQGESELGLGLSVAARVVGIDPSFLFTRSDLANVPPRLRKRFDTGFVRHCATFGQGRTIVALWLAAQATPGARQAFDRATQPVGYPSSANIALQDMEYGVMGSRGVQILWGTREADYVKELLRRDGNEVAAAVRANWDRLVDPATDSEDAAIILGLEPEPAGRSAVRKAADVGSPPCE